MTIIIPRPMFTINFSENITDSRSDKQKQRNEYNK